MKALLPPPPPPPPPPLPARSCALKPANASHYALSVFNAARAAAALAFAGPVVDTLPFAEDT
jgi:hypothetical protein